MRPASTIILMKFSVGLIHAQDIDTFFLKYGVSKYDTIIYKRIIEFDKNSKIYHVKDYFENGQIQMDALYSLFDKNIKEGSQCNYSSNRKEGLFKNWFENGQIKYSATYKNGLINGLSTTHRKQQLPASKAILMC